MEDLRGLHVLVTGATGAVGQALVETALACGANVTAVSRRRTALDSVRADVRHNDRLNVAECDVSDAKGVEKLFDAIERGTGPLFGVVHSVGGFAYAPLAKTEDDTIEMLYRSLLLSSIVVARAAVRRMIPRGKGRIVLFGGLASTKPSPNVAVYAAMKAGVSHLVQSVAVEVSTSGVTVNAVLPGVIDTPANRREMSGHDPSRWVAPSTLAKAVMALMGDGGAGVSGSLLTVPDRV